MIASHPIITIVGGSGFLGRYVIKELAKAGYRLRVISRNPDAALHLKTAGDPGQIVLVSGNIARPETLAGKLAGSYAVVNLVGILFETGAQTFDAIQARGAENLAKMARADGVQRFIQLSALGVDKAIGSHYARTKLMGEKAVIAAFPTATILRPSVIFGAEDNFFNQFAAAPIIPIIGGGETRFQPVYADDVAKAVAHAIARPETAGQTYELGGSAVYSFKSLMDFVQRAIDKKKLLLPLSFGMAALMAFTFELAFTLIPLIRRPLLTRDQVRLLRQDNVVSAGAKTFAELGITPTSIKDVVPQYLARFNPKKAR